MTTGTYVALQSPHYPDMTEALINSTCEVRFMEGTTVTVTVYELWHGIGSEKPYALLWGNKSITADRSTVARSTFQLQSHIRLQIEKLVTEKIRGRFWILLKGESGRVEGFSQGRISHFT